VKAVQRMLGHASAAMTLDTYADLFDDDLDAVAARLNAQSLVALPASPQTRPSCRPDRRADCSTSRRTRRHAKRADSAFGDADGAL
jgi:phage-related baseplate assembly protein